MPQLLFRKLPDGLAEIETQGNDINVTSTTRAVEDECGWVAEGPAFQNFRITCPVQKGGDLPLKRLSAASLSDNWKSKYADKAELPTAEISLDTQDGWTVTYFITGLIVDEYLLNPSANGQGFEEILSFRAMIVERTINGGSPIPFDPFQDPNDG